MNGRSRITVVTTRAVQIGEELTCSYGFDDCDGAVCYCGCVQCQGFMGHTLVTVPGCPKQRIPRQPTVISPDLVRQAKAMIHSVKAAQSTALAATLVGSVRARRELRVSAPVFFNSSAPAFLNWQAPEFKRAEQRAGDCLAPQAPRECTLSCSHAVGEKGCMHHDVDVKLAPDAVAKMARCLYGMAFSAIDRPPMKYPRGQRFPPKLRFHAVGPVTKAHMEDIMTWALQGRPPSQRSSARMLLRHTRQPPPSWQGKRPPGGLEAAPPTRKGLRPRAGETLQEWIEAEGRDEGDGP